MKKKENTFRPLLSAVRTPLLGTVILALIFFAIRFPSAIYGGWKETALYYLISFRYCAIMGGLFWMIWTCVGWFVSKNKDNLVKKFVQTMSLVLCIAVSSVVLYLF